MPVSEQPNAERAGVLILSVNSEPLLRSRQHTHVVRLSRPSPVQTMEEVLSKGGNMKLYWVVGK